ncbi:MULTISPECIES: efflux RND transporter periplasmic adaptor subunit [Methylobacillus]|uniref:Secretion protein HlyD n=1 Tax=Methylobacillus flagellatus (strain ATCC 51484 / DSM 6875 / VKM B-1610 / KT) TaxID=265072 RepID=Q1GY70_METFK|nr:efflux RND transporter periplasmic adaptor subunit [Methylobacillus flagellatus]ABE50817.1 secretion protein HlyD [Methylobacillus flagellatus KT]
MSLDNLKKKLPLKQLPIILNIVLVGVLLAVLILRNGQPQRQEFDEAKAEAAADKTVAQHEHGNEGAEVKGRVTMSDRQVKLNGIELLKAEPARIRTSLRLIGEIRVNSDRNVQVVPRLPGIVETVSANAGEKVRKGQLLAVISSQSIADQRSELLAAEKRLALAQLTYAREKKLWEEKISAEQDYQQARQVQQEAEIAVQQARQKLQAIGASTGSSNLTRYEIRSPIDGIITEKQVATGQVLVGTENLFLISDLSTVWAEMRIYAKDINTVKVGQQVVVKSTAFEAEAQGTVTYVGALVGQESRTAMARVVLQNPDRTWLPGLPVNIDLKAQEIEVAVAVSTEALQELDGETVIFRREGEYFQTQPVKLGHKDERYAEVVEGISAGDTYASENSYLVKAELGKAHAEHEE